MPDEMVLKLSDAFVPSVEEDDVVLECKTRMLNINYGHNQQLLNTCQRLHDYAYFVEEVNRNLDKKETLEVAINKAMDTCIEKGVLVDILEKCRSEVFYMILTEYDEKKHLRNVREEGRQEGREELDKQLNSLYAMLIDANRMDDVARAIKDKEFRDKLMKEFGL